MVLCHRNLAQVFGKTQSSILHHARNLIRKKLHYCAVFFFNYLRLRYFISPWPGSCAACIKLPFLTTYDSSRVFLFSCIFGLIKSWARTFSFIEDCHPLSIGKLSATKYLLIFAYTIGSRAGYSAFACDFGLFSNKFLLFGERILFKSFRKLNFLRIISTWPRNFFIIFFSSLLLPE